MLVTLWYQHLSFHKVPFAFWLLSWLIVMFMGVTLCICLFPSVLQTPMKKTKTLIGDAGATFLNAVSTFTQQRKVDKCSVLHLSTVCKYLHLCMLCRFIRLLHERPQHLHIPIWQEAVWILKGGLPSGNKEEVQHDVLHAVAGVEFFFFFLTDSGEENAI